MIVGQLLAAVIGACTACADARHSHATDGATHKSVHLASHHTSDKAAGKVTVQVASVVATADGGLVRDVTLNLKDAKGQPLRDAAVDVSVDMPSMPMAHHVPKVSAKPGAQPGSYVARIAFEMPGEWAAKVEVSKPIKATAVRKFTVAK